MDLSPDGHSEISSLNQIVLTTLPLAWQDRGSWQGAGKAAYYLAEESRIHHLGRLADPIEGKEEGEVDREARSLLWGILSWA